MFILSKTKTFEAAHSLPKHDGKCKGLHGHSYSVTVIVEGPAVGDCGTQTGMLLDYGQLGDIMDKHVGALDHKNLNDMFAYPTAENMARFLFTVMAPDVARTGICLAKLAAVSVSETVGTCAEYRP